MWQGCGLAHLRLGTRLGLGRKGLVHIPVMWRLKFHTSNIAGMAKTVFCVGYTLHHFYNQIKSIYLPILFCWNSAHYQFTENGIGWVHIRWLMHISSPPATLRDSSVSLHTFKRRLKTYILISSMMNTIRRCCGFLRVWRSYMRLWLTYLCHACLFASLPLPRLLDNASSYGARLDSFSLLKPPPPYLSLWEHVQLQLLLLRGEEPRENNFYIILYINIYQKSAYFNWVIRTVKYGCFWSTLYAYTCSLFFNSWS